MMNILVIVMTWVLEMMQMEKALGWRTSYDFPKDDRVIMKPLLGGLVLKLLNRHVADKEVCKLDQKMIEDLKKVVTDLIWLNRD